MRMGFLRHGAAGKRALCLTAALLTALLLCAPALADDSQPAPPSYRHVCMPSKSAGGATVYAQPGTSSAVITKISAAGELVVVGETSNYYRVLVGDQLGYVQKEMVRLTARADSEALPEAILGTAALEDPIPKLFSNYLVLTGSIVSDVPVDTLFAYLWDERHFTVEKAYMRTLERPAASISASTLKSFLPIGNVDGGRKTLVIQGAANGELRVLFRSPVYIRGKQEDPSSVTGMCAGLNDALLDTKVSTAWMPTKRQPALTVTIPEAADATLMTIEWKVIPDSFTVELYGDGNRLISSDIRETGRYVDWVALTREVRTVTVAPVGEEAGISTLRVYGQTYSRHAVQQWEDIPEKIDILAVSTHQDDEFLFLGGTIPYYSWRDDVTLAVMYMTDGGRMRMREALEGLWTAGLRYYPITLGMEDKYSLNRDQAGGRWKKYDPAALVVRALRRYKPEVIVCQDFNGEYGHGQHQYTVQLLSECLALANDPTFDPASAAQYGVWQVKKMYSHLYPENQIRMKWDQPLDSTGVITPMFLAKEAYDKHRTQQASFSMEYHGELYDNTMFGLYYSAVGPDVEKNDFMENVR